jgi:hypothetical protein
MQRGPAENVEHPRRCALTNPPPTHVQVWGPDGALAREEHFVLPQVPPHPPTAPARAPRRALLARACAPRPGAHAPCGPPPRSPEAYRGVPCGTPRATSGGWPDSSFRATAPARSSSPAQRPGGCCGACLCWGTRVVPPANGTVAGAARGPGRRREGSRREGRESGARWASSRRRVLKCITLPPRCSACPPRARCGYMMSSRRVASHSASACMRGSYGMRATARG